MRTVHEVSKLAGVSIRTLQYYDRIGLLRPAGHTEAGYRLYDDTDLARLQQILLFRELEFPLREQDPASGQAQALVEKLQAYISEHFYTCTKQVLSGLGKMYTGGGDFTKNIDEAGGPGTVEFADRAIQIYCN